MKNEIEVVFLATVIALGFIMLYGLGCMELIYLSLR